MCIKFNDFPPKTTCMTVVVQVYALSTEQLTDIDSIVVERQCTGPVVGRVEISQKGVGNRITRSLQKLQA